MQKIAAALVKAQKEKDFQTEALLMKKFADKSRPLTKVNASSCLPMPERFYSKLIFGSSDCWIWRGHVDDIGYGRFPFDGENKAHRVSYKLHSGQIPYGMFVMHKCDNRQCVNPQHLILGTQRDNMQDMKRKGRGKSNPQYGECNPMAKLTSEKVDQIRIECLSGRRQCDVAKEFGVSNMTVSRIIRKETWK